MKVTGHVIHSVIQGKGIAGRYREAVFLILLENTQKEEAYTLADTIRQIVFETFFDVPRHISISAGISIYDPEEVITEWIQETGKKLAVAQKNGGNQIIL